MSGGLSCGPRVRPTTSPPSVELQTPISRFRGRRGSFLGSAGRPSVLVSGQARGRPGAFKGWSSDNQILESLLQFSTPHPTPGTVPRSVQLLRKAEVREDRLLAWTWPQMASITSPDSSGKSPLLALWLLEGKMPKHFSSGTVGFLRISAVCRGEKEADHREGREGQWGQKETEASKGMKSREQGKEPRQKGAVRGANPRTDRKPWGCLGRWTPQSRGG